MVRQWQTLSTIGSCQQSMFTKAWINSEGFTITFVPATLAPSISDILAVEFLASRSRGRETKWHPRTYPPSTGSRHPAAPGQYYLLKPCCHNKIAGRSTVHYLTSCDWLEWDQKSVTFFGIVPLYWSTPQSWCNRALAITVSNRYSRNR